MFKQAFTVSALALLLPQLAVASAEREPLKSVVKSDPAAEAPLPEQALKDATSAVGANELLGRYLVEHYRVSGGELPLSLRLAQADSEGNTENAM